MDIPVILAIDFDLTIAKVNNFPNIEGFIDRADYYIRKLYEEGYYIIIWTCRSGKNEAEAREFLIANNIPFHQINNDHPKLIEFYKEQGKKCAADVYIDDKCLMGLPHWDEIYRIIKSKEFKQPCLSVCN